MDINPKVVLQKEEKKDIDINDIVNDVVNNTVNNTVNAVVNDVVNNTVNDVVNNTVNNTVNAVVNDVVNNTVNDVVNNTVNAVVNDVVNDVVNAVVNDVVNDTVNDVVNNTVNAVVNDVVNDTVNDVVQDAINDVVNSCGGSDIINNTLVCYCIRNETKNKTYVGATNHFTRRIRQHNREIVGGAKATSGHKWHKIILVYGFNTRHDLLSFEWHFKHVVTVNKYGVKRRAEALKKLLLIDRWKMLKFVVIDELKTLFI
jgi:predicted GIY-YIG superfamily endonuclease